MPKVTELGARSARAVLLQNLCSRPGGCVGGGLALGGILPKEMSLIHLFIHSLSLCFLMELTFLFLLIKKD